MHDTTRRETMCKSQGRIAGGAIAMMLATTAFAAPADLLRDYEKAASEASPLFSGLSAERGAQFFRTPHGGEWSCASCHTAKPLVPGQHAKTGKTIEPLAPSVNAQRFSDPARVEKWFRRNCNDVLSRPCTPQEKGDVLAFLLSLQ
jgi:hypothetical protein